MHEGTQRPERLLLTDQDLYLFNEGTHIRLYEHLGSHLVPGGTHFAVWAPDAAGVSVVGNFNGWDPAAHPLGPSDSGIWRGTVDGLGTGTIYKYNIRSRLDERILEKADPLAFTAEIPPKTASVIWDLDYQWGDGEWMTQRGRRNALDAPISIYELHIGSWRKKSREESYSYRELAPLLGEYVADMGYTHVEMMPVTEHPYYPSWGYQATGYFAPTSRFGTPQDFMYLVDHLHRRGIGVLLDWVPSHFATDAHGLYEFDGSHLYEHADRRKGWHPDWNSAIFNYGRNEVRSFLLSSANFWLDRYHIDGLRVDAVASMLYLDYSRKNGEWEPNVYGGNENLEAISFLRDLNTRAYGEHPGIIMVAEESTAWGGVSRPAETGGLGFGLKWDMGWMHDTLGYLARQPVHRAYHHDALTFRMLYAFTENFVLSLSHDEVVHMKGSLVNKMPGDQWHQYANLRLLYGYMYGMAGKKLLFMGGEFGQRSEWSVDDDLDWHVLDYPHHAGMQQWVRDLNRTYQEVPALHLHDCDPGGFEWVDASDAAGSVLTFLRTAEGHPPVLVVCNFTPVTRHEYRVGVPSPGSWRELLNSDATRYWGSGAGNGGAVVADDEPWHNRPHSLNLTLPPLAALFFVPA